MIPDREDYSNCREFSLVKEEKTQKNSDSQVFQRMRTFIDGWDGLCYASEDELTFFIMERLRFLVNLCQRDEDLFQVAEVLGLGEVVLVIA